MAYGFETLPPGLKKRRDIEWRIPHDAADYRDGPCKPIYRKPFALDTGTVIDRNAPGPFADDETAAAA